MLFAFKKFYFPEGDVNIFIFFWINQGSGNYIFYLLFIFVIKVFINSSVLLFERNLINCYSMFRFTIWYLMLDLTCYLIIN